MRIGWNARLLTLDERKMVGDVFGDTLPKWGRIILDDGLGLGDAPWTDDPLSLYAIHIGPEAYKDATATADYNGFGPIRDILVHEMTHVWQYYHGYWVKLSSVASGVSGGYAYDLGKPWDSYNVEQQASIVEHWFHKGKSPSDPRYPYIQYIIRAGLSNSDPQVYLAPDKLGTK